MKDIDRLEEYLQQQDLESLQYRAERAQFLLEHFGESRHMLLPEMAFYYINEAKLCYISGAFVACILVIQSALEDILRNFCFIVPRGYQAKKHNFEHLIDDALKRRIINKTEAVSMHKIRKLRNPYVHTKHVTHSKALSRRIKESNFEKDAFILMKEDAEQAIICLFSLVRRYPFSFYVGKDTHRVQSSIM
jgi:hypothetical protein